MENKVETRIRLKRRKNTKHMLGVCLVLVFSGEIQLFLPFMQQSHARTNTGHAQEKIS